jgi:hypothetical protein
VLFVNPAATQAQRLAGSPYVQSRRQVAPIEADSKVGDRPDDHAGDTAAVTERPAAMRRTGRHIDMYV